MYLRLHESAAGRSYVDAGPTLSCPPQGLAFCAVLRRSITPANNAAAFCAVSSQSIKPANNAAAPALNSST
eukprot:786883-Alexandrium_andersonii.AAC.1